MVLLTNKASVNLTTKCNSYCSCKSFHCNYSIQTEILSISISRKYNSYHSKEMRIFPELVHFYASLCMHVATIL